MLISPVLLKVMAQPHCERAVMKGAVMKGGGGERHVLRGSGKGRGRGGFMIERAVGKGGGGVSETAVGQERALGRGSGKGVE